MRKNIADRIWNILICPDCGHSLQKTDDGAICSNCQIKYNYIDTGALDLRLKNHKEVRLQFDLGSNLPSETKITAKPLQRNKLPEVDFSGVKMTWNVSEELMSYFPKAKGNDNIVLDLGCGSTLHRELCEHAGFEYVGIDFDSPNASILADAHALPFKNNSFNFMISINVFEHCQYPFVVTKEANRVLKSNSKFIGVVSFLEPFHGNSFYHHTHLGTLNSLRFGGFDVEYIAPNKKWTVFIAQAYMGFFPKMPKILSKLLVLPLQALHRFWWGIGGLMWDKDKNYRLQRFAGSFAFIAKKV